MIPEAVHSGGCRFEYFAGRNMKTIKLKLSAAVVIHGGICLADREVEVTEDVAKNLLHRGRAVLAGDNIDLNEENKKAARAAEEAAKARAEAEKAAIAAKSSTTPETGKK